MSKKHDKSSFVKFAKKLSKNDDETFSGGVKRVSGDSLLAVGSFFNAIGEGFKAVGRFLARHWAAVAAVLLATAVAAVVTALIVFVWPIVIPTLAALAVTLPFVGTLSLGFLLAMPTLAASAIVGATAGLAFLAASAPVVGLFEAYSAIDAFFQELGTKAPATAPAHRNGAGNEEDYENELDATSSSRLAQLSSSRQSASASRRYGADVAPEQFGAVLRAHGEEIKALKEAVFNDENADDRRASLTIN